jgi:hypothetical protein
MPREIEGAGEQLRAAKKVAQPPRLLALVDQFPDVNRASVTNGTEFTRLLLVVWNSRGCREIGEFEQTENRLVA